MPDGEASAVGPIRTAAVRDEVAVLPRVPVRQFVLTVPFVLRAKMAYDAVLAAEVRSALHTSVQRAYARRARTRGIRRGHTGGVTAVQRFGSGLNLHVHLHALVLDGVFFGDDATQLLIRRRR